MTLGSLRHHHALCYTYARMYRRHFLKVARPKANNENY